MKDSLKDNLKMLTQFSNSKKEIIPVSYTA